VPESPLPEVEEWGEEELLAGEFATLGFYVSSHPLAKYAGRLQEMGVTEIGALEGCGNEEEVKIAGLVASVRQMRSKRGERWAIVSLQDMTGLIEVLVFSRVFTLREHILQTGAALILKGRVSQEEAGLRVVVADVRQLDQVVDPPRPLCVRIDSGIWNEGKMDELDRLFRAKQGTSAVDLEVVTADGTVTRIQTSRKVQADEDLLARVRQLCGPESVVQ
jgi:DNA polymerase-3 subunit alpha